MNLTYFTRNGDALSVGDYLNKDEIYLLDNFKISSADDTNDIGSTYHALINTGDLDIDIAGGSGSDLAKFRDVADTTNTDYYYNGIISSTGTSSWKNFMIAPDRTYKVLDIKKNDNSIILSLESQDYKVTFKDFTKRYTPWNNTPKEVVKGIDNRLTDSDFPENASDIFLVYESDYKKITKNEIKNLSEDKEVYYIPKYANIECIHGGTGDTLGKLQFPLKENEIVFDSNIIDESTVLYDVSDLPNKIFNGQSYDEWIIHDDNWVIDGHDISYLVKLATSPNCYFTSKAYALVQDSPSKCEEVTSINYSGKWLGEWLVNNNTSFDRNLINFSVSNKPPIGHNFQSGTPSNITNTITTQEQLTNLINNAESVKLDNQPYTNQAIDLSKVTSIIKTECGRAPEQCTSPKAYEVEIITQASTPPTPPTPPSNPHEHAWGTPKKENEKEPTCTKEGSYDLVTRCESCGAELKREHKIIEPLGHIWEDSTWTKLEKSQVNKELFNKAENASKLDFSKLKDTDDVWKRLCSRASDAYELRVVDSDLVGTVSGVLKDKNGKPIANAKVTLHSTPRTIYTNEKGEYKFEDVESGNHTLNVYVSDNSVYQGYIFISNDSTVETVDKSKDYEAIEDAKDTNVTVDINGLDSSNPSGGGDNPSDNPDDVDDPDNPDDVDDPDNPNDNRNPNKKPNNPNDFDDPDDFPGDTPEGLPNKVPEDTPTDEPDDTPDGRPHKTSDYNIWILYMMLALSIGTLITSVFRGRKKK